MFRSLQMAELNKLTDRDLEYPYNQAVMMKIGREKEPAYV